MDKPPRRRAQDSGGATPAMARWRALKDRHPDALLFYRMGDFYELFFEDATSAAAVLGITLTTRGEQDGLPIPLCGVPAHAAEGYLARLIRRGFRVAVAEQMEEASAVRGRAPIARDVVRVVTPGTLTEDSLLEAGRANLLLALALGPQGVGAAWLDVSCATFETMLVADGELPNLLARLDPAEIVADADTPLGDWTSRRAPGSPAMAGVSVARVGLAEAYGVASLDALGEFTNGEAQAALRAIDYVRLTQAGGLPKLGRPTPSGSGAARGLLGMDAATRASLEIARARDGGGEHTLLACVRKTVGAAGARLLEARLKAPLADPEAIASRQDAWSWLLAVPDAARKIRETLAKAPDAARAFGRLSVGRGRPSDLAAVRIAILAAHAAAGIIEESAPPCLQDIRAALSGAPAPLADLLGDALAEAPPSRSGETGAVKPGFDGELDAECALRDDSRRILASMQVEFAERYGVASLRIRHHAQLGYVIEAPAGAVEVLRAHPELTLRQGMANGARFTNASLSDLDRRITEAAARAAAREAAILAHLTALVLEAADPCIAAADALAALDVAQGAARLAEAGQWCRPTVTEGEEFAVEGLRHPVVEAALAGRSAFVANDCDLSPARRLMLLTGPNMAGKSTYLRACALAVVLAQAGLPLPARSARIGVVDRLFSRVGAADDLARGRSTFMVEMTETAAILNQAGPRSLVVVDEIGRGTSTRDGLAIAWAVLEALHSTIRARTIFATHFHELAQLADRLPRLSPHTMRVREWKGGVVFLHEVVPGAAGRSWGVHVAELAGVPNQVVRRARALLSMLDGRAGALEVPLPLFGEPMLPPEPETAPGPERLEPRLAEAVAAIAAADPDALAPRAALELIYAVRALLSGGGNEESLPSAR